MNGGAAARPRSAPRRRAPPLAGRLGSAFAIGARIARRAAACLPLVACSVGVIGATDAELARARDATASGAAVFSSECASCHGRRGEGIADAPPILGPRALPKYARERPASGVPGVQDPQEMQIELQTRRTGSGLRGPFRNALDVYDFVSAHAPKSRKESSAAKADRDWAVVTYLMAAQGAALPDTGVTPDNAESIPVPRR